MDMDMFNLTATQEANIDTIIERAASVYTAHGQSCTTMYMDLCVANAECPLDLPAMAKAARHDLVHDVAGIRRHMDRDKFQLTGGFLPRFALDQPEPA